MTKGSKIIHRVLCRVHPSLGHRYWLRFHSYKVTVRRGLGRSYKTFCLVETVEDAFRLANWSYEEDQREGRGRKRENV